MANVRHGEGFDAAEDALRRAREDAAQRGESRIVTSNEEGFHDCFSERMRNPRVPVAAVSPSSSLDWSSQCAPPNVPSCPLPRSHVTDLLYGHTAIRTVLVLAGESVLTITY